MRICPVCSSVLAPRPGEQKRDFLKRATCGRKCGNILRARRHQPGPPSLRVELICPRCGETFMASRSSAPRRRFCSKACQRVDPGTPRGDLSKKQVRKHGRRVLAEAGVEPVCPCGYDKHVEVAHVRALASFPEETPISEVNAPENLRYLCPNCHWEFDNL